MTALDDDTSLSYNSFLNRSVLLAGDLFDSIDKDIADVRKIIKTRAAAKDASEEIVTLLRKDNKVLEVKYWPHMFVCRCTWF